MLTAVLLGGGTAAAQTSRRFSKGDEVLVPFLGEMRAAVVMETDSRRVLAEFEFAGAVKQQAFPKFQVIFAFENGAIAPARTWTNANSQFKVFAAALGIAAGKVKLRKSDNLVIEVPVDQLSVTDQAFIKRLQKESGAGAAGQPSLPPVETFDAGNQFGSLAWGADRQALAADPVPSYQTVSQAGVAFARDDFHDRMGAVIPIGGPDQWVLGSVENAFNSADSPPTRLVWVTLAGKKAARRQVLSPGEFVLDYHPPSHRLLTASSPESEILLTVWEVLPTDDAARPIVRWKANAGERLSVVSEPWARIIDGNLVVHRREKQEYDVWDLSQKRLAYSIKQESFFAPPIALSPGRAYLVIPEDKQVRVLDAATGNAVSVLPTNDRASGVAIDDAGRQLAVLGATELSVWDLTRADVEPRTFQAEAIGTPFEARMAWVSPTRLLVESKGLDAVLFSLDHEIALWRYRTDTGGEEAWNQRTRDMLNGHLVYAAAVGSRQGFAIGAVKLPGPKVDEVAASVDREQILVLKPGVHIRLAASTGQYQQQVQAALQAKIAENGWVLDPAAPIVMSAEMKRGNTQQTTYEYFGGRQPQTVTVTPFISSLRIDVQGEVAWQAGTSTGAPPVVTVRDGGSIQNEVNKFQQPDPGFFERVKIPPRILDPSKKNGFGLTMITNRGLVPEQ